LSSIASPIEEDAKRRLQPAESLAHGVRCCREDILGITTSIARTRRYAKKPPRLWQHHHGEQNRRAELSRFGLENQKFCPELGGLQAVGGCDLYARRSHNPKRDRRR
jgi:hypothetical protein